MDHVPDSNDDVNEWQQIQPPFPDDSSSTVHQSGGAWNLLVIQENYLLHDRRPAIPPPADLQDGNSTPPSSPTSASESSSSVSDQDVSSIPLPSTSEWRLRVASEGWKLLKVRFEAIRDGVVRVVSKVRDYAICVGAFWSITYVTGIALAAVALLVYVGIQRRRRSRLRTLHQQRMDHMAYLVREKDERISQLLLQIAHLNEVLSSRRKVPVLRING